MVLLEISGGKEAKMPFLYNPEALLLGEGSFA